MIDLQKLKVRLVTSLVLAALALVMLAPIGQTEAASITGFVISGSGSSMNTRVSWNSGGTQ